MESSRIFKKAVAIVTAAAVSLCGVFDARSANTAYAAESGYTDVRYSGAVSYYDYMTQYTDAARPSDVITINAAADFTDEAAGVRADSDSDGDYLHWDSQQGKVSWKFDVKKAGLYNLQFDYKPIKYKGNEIQLAVYIDGALPHDSASAISLPRIFLNDSYGDEFRRDSLGNQIRPTAIEQFDRFTHSAIDYDGEYNGLLSFYLTEGAHTLTVEMKLEQLCLYEIRFINIEETHSYSDTLAAWLSQGAKDTSGYYAQYEAEAAYLKSSNVLFPTNDRGSAHISPSSPTQTLYNTIGKNTWDKAGQYVTWEFSVPEDGFYNIAFKAKQNVKRGMYSTREVYIDDALLFEELANVQFPQKTSWYIKVLGGDEPYKLYLEKGTHILKMQVSTGDIADILRRIDLAVSELNGWYRKIIAITGSNADSNRVTVDTNRNFLLDQKISGLMEGFASIKESLEGTFNDIEQMYGGNSTGGSIIAEMTNMLAQLIKKPDTIAKRLEVLRGGISSMSAWTLEMRQQPLELDYFAIYSPDVAAPKIDDNFFKQVAFRFQMFINSFTQDYSAVGETDSGDSAINVWISGADLLTTGISSGRDQAQLLKIMADDMFTSQTGIRVNLSLVTNSATLIQAVLANEGPDAALFVSKDTPVNLAMRNALVPLSEFQDFDAVTQQFMPNAIIPYKYRGEYYALPETQNFDVLFYRADIFEDLGVSVPNTWKDFYELIPKLQQNNMLIGIPESQRTFEALLYQYGGQFYNDDLSKTMLHTQEALNAFETWTGLYAKHSLPVVFDFFNRFRTGEMPMAIMPYTQVNYLAAAAPELKNLWAIAPIPGTLQNGILNRAETSNGTSAIILKDASDKDKAWQFIKWWASTSAQERFGIELEQNMGPAARYPTANVEAFKKLPWTKEQSDNLLEQWYHVTDIQQIPGNYYINRNIYFAFRNVVYKYENERETLYKYNREINKEITRKRNEFSLN